MLTVEPVQAVYQVPECNLENLEARIEKLNKRARKLGMKQITVASSFDCVKFKCSVSGSVCWLTRNEINAAIQRGKTVRESKISMAYFAVTVAGETPKYDGWQFIATLEPVKTQVQEPDQDRPR